MRSNFSVTATAPPPMIAGCNLTHHSKYTARAAEPSRPEILTFSLKPAGTRGTWRMAPSSISAPSAWDWLGQKRSSRELPFVIPMTKSPSA
jgi:hypothetical protein